MANSDRPRGAEPYGRQRRITPYTAGATIYPGDFVHMEADGLVDPAAAAEAICGVAVSYAAASGDEVLVADDPDQQFIVQADGSDIDAQTDINLNYDILATAGDSTYRRSNHELDSSTGNTTATLQLKLIGIQPRVGNALGAQVDCIVTINNHQHKGGTGTAGL